jgi:hypothetical protein
MLSGGNIERDDTGRWIRIRVATIRRSAFYDDIGVTIESRVSSVIGERDPVDGVFVRPTVTNPHDAKQSTSKSVPDLITGPNTGFPAPKTRPFTLTAGFSNVLNPAGD